MSIEDFILPFGPWLGRAPGWLKNCLVALGRCSGRSPDTRGMHRGPFKGSWTGGSEGALLELRLTPPKGHSSAQQQPVCQLDAQLLAEFHLLICEVIL